MKFGGVTMTEDSSDHIDLEALRRLRVSHRRMRRLLIASVTLVVGGLLLFLVMPASVGDWPNWVLEVGIIFTAVSIVLSFPFGRTPCPRCGKPYYVGSGFRGLFCKVSLSHARCVHCGLPLDADDHETVESSG